MIKYGRKMKRGKYLQQCNPDTGCKRDDVVDGNLGEVLTGVAGPHQRAPFLTDNRRPRNTKKVM